MSKKSFKKNGGVEKRVDVMARFGLTDPKPALTNRYYMVGGVPCKFKDGQWVALTKVMPA
jgi:hypothetical protein